jgi:hypothetical protein
MKMEASFWITLHSFYLTNYTGTTSTTITYTIIIIIAVSIAGRRG